MIQAKKNTQYSLIKLQVILIALFISACSDVEFASKSNESSDIVKDLTIPQINAHISLNNGDEFFNASDRSVEASLSSQGANEVLLTEDSSCESGGQYIALKDLNENSSSMNSKSKTVALQNNASYPKLTLYAKFRNSETGQESECVSDSILHDDSAPEITLIESPNGFLTPGPQVVKYTAADTGVSGIKNVLCQFETGSQFDCNYIINQVNEISNGSNVEKEYIVTLEAIDKAGNKSAPVEVKWTADGTGPTVQITESPNELTNVNVAMIRYTANDGNGSGVQKVECALDQNSNPSQCGLTSHFLNNMSSANHTFFVRAIDHVGNVGPWTEASFEVDTVGPGEFEVIGVAGGSDEEYDMWLGTNTQPSIKWLESFEAVRYQVQVLNADGSNTVCSEKVSIDQIYTYAATECINTNGTSRLIDGDSYVVQVISIDRAENKFAAPDFTFTVDTTPPVVVISGVDPEIRLPASQEAMVSVMDETSGIKTIVCEVNGIPQVCTESTEIIISSLPEGNHSIRVVATDNAGNSTEVITNFEVLPELPPEPVCHESQIVQDNVETPELDILFVVDTSGSLDQERAAVSSGIRNFIQNLDPQTDFRIAVMLAHGPTKTTSGSIFRTNQGEPEILTSAMGINTIVTHMGTKLTNPPEDHDSDGGEAGFYSLSVALNQKFQENKAKNFFRENAALAVVMVSDENDLCTRYPGRYPHINFVPDGEYLNGIEREIIFATNNCQNITKESILADINRVQDEKPFILSAIIYTNPSTVPNGGENEVGYGHKELVESVGSNGLLVDMAQTSNIAPGLSDIGTLTAEKLIKKTEIQINHSPVEIESVKRKSPDGTLADIPAYTYNETLNQVIISADDAGELGDTVTVKYCELDDPAE